MMSAKENITAICKKHSVTTSDAFIDEVSFNFKFQLKFYFPKNNSAHFGMLIISILTIN